MLGCIIVKLCSGVTIACLNQDKGFALWFALEAWDGKAEVGDEVREVKFFDADAIPPNTLEPSKVAIRLYQRYKETGKFQVS